MVGEKKNQSDRMRANKHPKLTIKQSKTTPNYLANPHQKVATHSDPRDATGVGDRDREGAARARAERSAVHGDLRKN